MFASALRGGFRGGFLRGNWGSGSLDEVFLGIKGKRVSSWREPSIPIEEQKTLSLSLVPVQPKSCCSLNRLFSSNAPQKPHLGSELMKREGPSLRIGQGSCRYLSMSSCTHKKKGTVTETMNQVPVIDVEEGNIPEEELSNLTIEERLFEVNYHAFRGRFEEAVSECDFLISHGFTLDDPSIGQRSYLLRAYSLKNLGKYNEALEDFLSSLKFKPHPLGIVGVAECLVGMGRVDSALQRYNEVLRSQPDLIPALGGRADIYLEKGDCTKALADYSAILKLEPSNVRGLVGLGDTYFHTGDPDRSLYWYVKGLEIIGKNVKRIEIFPRLPPMPVDSVEEDQEWLCAEDSRDAAPEAWKGMALSLYVKGNEDGDALYAIEKAVTLAKHLPGEAQIDYLHKKALILLRLGKYQQCLDTCREVEVLDEGRVFESDLLFLKAHSLYSLGDDVASLQVTRDYLDMCLHHFGLDESSMSEEDFSGLPSGLRASISDIFLLVARSNFHLYLSSIPPTNAVSLDQESWFLNRSYLSPPFESQDKFVDPNFETLQNDVFSNSQSSSGDQSLLKTSIRSGLTSLSLNPVTGEASRFLSFLLSSQKEGKLET